MKDLGKQKDFRLANFGQPSLRVLSVFSKGSVLMLADIVDAYMSGFAYKSTSQALSSARITRIASSLFETELIAGNEQSGYKLTVRGNWELARRRILDDPQNQVPGKWDRKWRIIIFDIPELKRKQRDMLRRAILGYGMYQLQQSVWVYPYSCTEFVNSIKHDLGFRSEVLVILGDSIENQNELEREFGLK